MKQLVKTLLLLLLPAFANAQDNFEHLPTKSQADSIERALQNAPDDTLKLVMCRELERFYLRQNKDTSFLFLEQGLALAQKLNQKLWEAQSLHNMSYFSLLSGDYPKAFKVLLEALKIAENESIEKNIFRVSNFSKELIPHKARLNV